MTRKYRFDLQNLGGLIVAFLDMSQDIRSMERNNDSLYLYNTQNGAETDTKQVDIISRASHVLVYCQGRASTQSNH